MSRRTIAWIVFVALVNGLILAFGLAGGGRAGLIPGGGNPRSDCFVEFDVQGVTEESNHVICTDGDPCDADGRCDDVCTFRVRVCVNQTNMPDCRPTTFKKPPQVSFPLTVPSMHNDDSACGAFTDIPVKVKKGKAGRKRLETRAISRSKPKQDKDILFLLCLPRQGSCPTTGTTTTTIRAATTTTRVATTSTTSAGATTTTTTSPPGAIQCCLRSSPGGAVTSPGGCFTMCMVLSASQCAAQGGISAGSGTCSPNPCPPSSTTTSVVSTTTSTTTTGGTIRCCVQSTTSPGGAFSTCIEVTPAQCMVQQGINVGPGRCPASRHSVKTRGGVTANPCPTTVPSATTTTAHGSTTTTSPAATTTTTQGSTTTTSPAATTTTAHASTTTTSPEVTTTTTPSTSTTTTTMGPTTHTVHVGPSETFTFSPSSLTINVGDTVQWVWDSDVHTVTSGAECTADGMFCSPNDTNCASGTTSNAGATYEHTFTTAGTFSYFCTPHCTLGMVGSITVQ